MLNDEDYWRKAELFNVVVLNSDNFRKIIGREEKGYDIHKKFFRIYKDVWKESKNLNSYLLRAAKLK